MDALARELEIDPLELRRRNYAARRSGKAAPVLGEAARRVLRARRRAIRMGRARDRDKRRTIAFRRGVGMASLIWGAGGGPPAYATVRINRDGTIEVLTGAQDLGTGARTVLSQIAAEVLGARLERRAHDPRRHRAIAVRVELVGLDHDGVGRAGGARGRRGGARLTVRGGRRACSAAASKISNRATARSATRAPTAACSFSDVCEKARRRDDHRPGEPRPKSGRNGDVGVRRALRGGGGGRRDRPRAGAADRRGARLGAHHQSDAGRGASSRAGSFKDWDTRCSKSVWWTRRSEFRSTRRCTTTRSRRSATCRRSTRSSSTARTRWRTTPARRALPSRRSFRVAPAIANAVADALGVEVNEMPLAPWRVLARSTGGPVDR